ncbi:MAG: PH domain-containing protein [Planctomycetota bacterium]
MAEFTFACPHCAEPQRVPEGRLDGPVACAACKLPFRARVPDARLVGAEGQALAATGDEPEREVASFHPAAFRQSPMRTVGWVGLFLVGAVVAVVSMVRLEGTPQAVLAWAGVGLAVLAALGLGVMAFLTRFEVLRVTTQRSVWVRGIIERRTSEVQHDDIRNIQLEQSIVERLVGVGCVAISSAGQDDMEIVVRGLAAPSAVIDTIREHQRRLVSTD